MFRRARHPVVSALVHTLALGALAAATSGAWAQSVYRYVDPTGRVVYSDRLPASDAKNVQTKRIGANYVETSEPSLTSQMAAERFPATLYLFECGEVCQNAEAALNRRGVPFTRVDVQRDESGITRLKALTGEENVPVLTLGDKIVVKGFNNARWQAALDEAGYPKAPASRTGPAKGPAAPAASPAPAPAPAAASGSRTVAPTQKGGDYPK